MATLALETALAAMRTRIAAQTSLTAARTVDTVTNEPDARQPLQFSVWSDRTRNLSDRRASKSSATVEDRVIVEIVGRLTVAEVAAFATLLGTSRDVREALTNAAWWRGAGMMCVEYSSEARQRREGWVIIRQEYALTRAASLG